MRIFKASGHLNEVKNLMENHRHLEFAYGQILDWRGTRLFETFLKLRLSSVLLPEYT